MSAKVLINAGFSLNLHRLLGMFMKKNSFIAASVTILIIKKSDLSVLLIECKGTKNLPHLGDVGDCFYGILSDSLLRPHGRMCQRRCGSATRS